jgi:hypothetical protein
MSERASWSVEHFLRRVADSIEQLGKVEIQDLVMHSEATADGSWPSLTVYFHRQHQLRAVR